MLRNLRTGLNIRDERFKTYGTDGRIFLETHGTEGEKSMVGADPFVCFIATTPHPSSPEEGTT